MHFIFFKVAALKAKLTWYQFYWYQNDQPVNISEILIAASAYPWKRINSKIAILEIRCPVISYRSESRTYQCKKCQVNKVTKIVIFWCFSSLFIFTYSARNKTKLLYLVFYFFFTHLQLSTTKKLCCCSCDFIFHLYKQRKTETELS